MGLGDKAAALALAERAIAAVPIEKDAVVGPGAIEVLARVAAQMGEPDRAIAALQKLLSIPSSSALVTGNLTLTPALLRLDPMFDPLRNDPRFQKLGRVARAEVSMSAEVKKEIELEIAHVLFIDIVGYSKLSINEQHAGVEELNGIVRVSEQFQKAEAANRLLKIPTGDGMALVFYKSPEAPAQCAVEISRALKDNPRLQVRMGIHSGPVSGVVDVNERANLAGAGLNMAQRVMDCGDAGHILLSKHVAEDLEEYEKWRPLLHDLGSCEVKHGVRVSVVNLYDDQVGNAKLPQKVSRPCKKRSARVRWAGVAAALLVLAAIIAGFAMFSRYRMRSTLAAPEKAIAVLPFENLSEDKANAYFADGIQEEILTRLAKIADLKVISRTSTQRYQSKPGNLARDREAAWRSEHS